MKSKTLVMTACLLSLAAASAAAQESSAPRLVYETIEPASQAQIRVYKTEPGALSWSVTHPSVTIRKEISPRRVVTAVETDADRLVLTSSSAGVTFERPGRVLTVRAGDRSGAAVVRSLVTESEAFRRAAALLRAIELPFDSPAGYLVATTRAFLLVAAGDMSGMTAVENWARRRAAGPRVRPASMGADDVDCWEMYAVRAIEIWAFLQECIRNNEWYDVVGYLICEVAYEVFAAMAFAQFVNCHFSTSAT